MPRMDEMGYVPLPDRGVIALQGADKADFLQGLVSNDVRLVATDRAIYACLLTPQGKFVHDLFVVGTADPVLGDAFLLECEGGRRQDLVRRLRMFKLRSKIELLDVTERYGVAVVLGDAPDYDPGAEPGAARQLAGGTAYRDPRAAGLGIRLILERPSLDTIGLPQLPHEAYERRRLELGVPDGSRDMVVEKAILLENNIDRLHGISWDKGCYMGQELTARTRYRGLVKKRLIPVSFEGQPPEAGSPVLDGETEIGEMRSGVAGRGLALLRLEALERASQGDRLLTAGGKAIHPEWQGEDAGARQES